MKLLDRLQGLPVVYPARSTGPNPATTPNGPRPVDAGFVWGHFETRAKGGKAEGVFVVLTPSGQLAFRTAGRPASFRPDWN